MGETIMETNEQAADASVENQEPAAKTYSQEEFDNHMAGLKNSLTRKFEKQIAELGDLEELKTIRANAEQQKQEEAIKRGEFEKILQEKIAAKDAEIYKRDQQIKEYKVNTPLLNAASKYRSVNPEQVKALLMNRVSLDDEGHPVALDANGQPMYNDRGVAVGVDELVQTFLNENPHFVSPAPSTTSTKTNDKVGVALDEFDISKLDLSKAEHREIYKQARAKGLA